MLIRITKALRNDQGAALASVLGLILVGALLSILIMSSVITAVGNTTATRASVQAQASARAGIAAAYAGLKTGTCSAKGGVYESTTIPKYRATIWFGANRGCPTGGGAVRIISTGYAAAPGVAGNKYGDVAYLEASYSIAAAQSSGSAVYVYAGGSFNVFTITPATPGVSADIQIPSGDLSSCSGSSIVNGSILVGAGSVNMSNSCSVTGSVRASGSITLNNANLIGGDVVASGGGAYIGGQAVISGNVYAAGDVTIHGKVNGNVEATGKVSIYNNAVIKGSISAGNDFTFNSGTVEGSVTTRGSAQLDGGTRILGSLTSGGAVSISGSVGVNLTAVGDGSMGSSSSKVGGDMTIGGSMTGNYTGTVTGALSVRGTGKFTFEPNSARVGGNLSVGGNISTWNTGSSDTNVNNAAWLKSTGRVGGAVAYQTSGLTLPTAPAAPTGKPAPTVQPWADWTYKKSDFTSAGFVEEVIWPSSKCGMDNTSVTTPSDVLYPIWQKMITATQPFVLNALNCSSIEFGNSAFQKIGSMKIKTDIAIVAKGIVLGDAVFETTDSTARKMYFLVQDGAPSTAGPDCNNGAGNIRTYGSTAIKSPIAAMFYTPCEISVNNGTTVRGQFYSKNISMSAGDGLTYLPIGIPGTNLDGGAVGGSIGTIGDATNIRSLTGNGE